MIELGLIYVAEVGYIYATSRAIARAQCGDRLYSNTPLREPLCAD